MLKGFIPLWPEQFTVLDKYIQLIIALFANAVILVQDCSFTCFYVIIIFLISYFSNTAILKYGTCFINLPTGGSTSRNVPRNTFFLPLWVKNKNIFGKCCDAPYSQWNFWKMRQLPISGPCKSCLRMFFLYENMASMFILSVRIWPQCSSCLWEYDLNFHLVCENMASMFILSVRIWPQCSPSLW